MTRKQIPTVKRKRKQIPVTTKVEAGIPQVPVIEAEVIKRKKGERVNVGTKELVNVIADTLQRLGYYSSMTDENSIRASCEQYAEVLYRAMTFGLNDHGYVISTEAIIRIVEEEYDEIPYCKEHEEA